MMTIDINTVTVAIVRNGGKNLGRCFNREHFLVFTLGNPDDKTYDDVCSRPSAMWRKELTNMLPSSNAGRSLGTFEKVAGTNATYVANAHIDIDSGD